MQHRRIIRPIQTEYNGYLFRSRLEARWAVFFDVMRYDYEYEPEGFDLGPDGLYLPDFWLPQVEMYAEVKPTHLSIEEKRKCACLVESTERSCLLLIGPPDFKEYWAYVPWRTENPYVDEHVDIEMWDYALISLYVHARPEGRFFSSPECSDWCDEEFGHDYVKAVHASRRARFERGAA